MNPLFDRIYQVLFRRFRPQMLRVKRDNSGRPLLHTRVSNTTHLDHPHRLKLGNHVFIGHFSFVDASHGVTIGEGVQITNYVSVLSHSSHLAIRVNGAAYAGQQDPLGYVTGPVEIGAYTFIGPHTVVMPQVRIGKGVLVSAYSYVKSDVPDFAIVAGNPASVVGDTRELDAALLDAHPELRIHYEKWANHDR